MRPRPPSSARPGWAGMGGLALSSLLCLIIAARLIGDAITGLTS
jgi:hypothetical protein